MSFVRPKRKFEVNERRFAGPAAKWCISCDFCVSGLPITSLYSPRANCGCFNEVFVLVDERISEGNLDTQIECLNCVICY